MTTPLDTENEIARLRADLDIARNHIADLEAYALGCDGEGCTIPHSSWCDVAKKTAAANDGCTCPQPWKDSPQPHAGYCWLVSPPRDEVEEMRKKVAEVLAGRNAAAIELGEAATRAITKAEAERDEARARITDLEAERKRYVGVEPTIAEEMAYLSSCLDAVHGLCEEQEKAARLFELPAPEWITAVRQAVDGEWTADTPRPALPWAHVMDDDDLHLFLGDLVSAAMGRWQSDPEVPDRTVLAAVEKACADWRTPGQGLRSDEPEAGEPSA